MATLRFEQAEQQRALLTLEQWHAVEEGLQDEVATSTVDELVCFSPRFRIPVSCAESEPRRRLLAAILVLVVSSTSLPYFQEGATLLEDACGAEDTAARVTTRRILSPCKRSVRASVQQKFDHDGAVPRVVDRA